MHDRWLDLHENELKRRQYHFEALHKGDTKLLQDVGIAIELAPPCQLWRCSRSVFQLPGRESHQYEYNIHPQLKKNQKQKQKQDNRILTEYVVAIANDEVGCLLRSKHNTQVLKSEFLHNIHSGDSTYKCQSRLLNVIRNWP